LQSARQDDMTATFLFLWLRVQPSLGISAQFLLLPVPAQPAPSPAAWSHTPPRMETPARWQVLAPLLSVLGLLALPDETDEGEQHARKRKPNYRDEKTPGLRSVLHGFSSELGPDSQDATGHGLQRISKSRRKPVQHGRQGESASVDHRG